MAKRVNIRFLTMLTVVVVSAAIIAVAGPYVLNKVARHNPRHWITQGDAAMAKSDWLSAAGNYNTALQLDPSNKEVCLHLGDAMYHMTSQDNQNLGRAIFYWNQALQNDPQYVPALHRLLTMYRELVRLHPMQQEFYGEVRDTARRLAKADPSDADAKAAVDVATVEQWQVGGSVSDKEFQHSLAALEAMVKKDPANSELVFSLGGARIVQAGNALKDGNADKADDYSKQARAVVESALAIKPNDPTLNLRAWQVFTGLAGSAHLTADRNAAKQAASAAITTAAAHVKPADAFYPDIMFSLAQEDFSQKKKSDAEAALRAYNQQFPDDLRGRIILASALAGELGKRDEGIALLSQPFPTTLESGPKGQSRKDSELSATEMLTEMEMDKYDTTSDAAERDKLMAKIEPQIKRLHDAQQDNPAILRMTGWLQTNKGQRYEAIKTLTRAEHILENSTHRDNRTFFVVLNQLGIADMNLGLGTSAEKAFEQAVKLSPSSVPLHLKLAALYLQDHNTEEARRHIEAVAKLSPDDPNLPRLQVALDQTGQHPEEAKADYAKLPETTHGDRLVKAQIAAGMGNLKEVGRLLRLALEEKPNDPAASAALANAQIRLGEKDRAIATLQAQLKLTPGNDRIALSIKQLQNASPGELKPLEDKLLNGGGAFAKAISKFGQDFNRREYDDALADLKDAEHAGGNEQLVAELYFQIYLLRQQYDQAAGVIGTLTRLNADDADGLTFQIRLAMAQNHRDDAIRLAQQLTRNRAELAMSWVMLGDAYRSNGQYDQALENYRQALDRQTMNSDALAGEIACYIALHDLDNAPTAIASARRLFPDNQTFRNIELNYKMTYGNPQEVVAELHANLAAHPDDPNGYLMLFDACMQTADSRSAGSGDDGPRPYLDQAHDAMAQALTKWPNDERFVPLMAQVEQAVGDFDGASKLLNDFAALPQSKGRAEPQLFLADLYNRAGKSKETEAALRAALADDKKNVDVQLKLSMFLGANGKYDDALAVLTEPSDAAEMRQRLALLVDAGRYPQAEADLKTALAKTPDNVDLIYLLSSLHSHIGHYQDAQADVQHGLSVDPKNVPLMLQSARIEMARPNGDLNLANRQLMTLLQAAPKNLDGHVALSDLFARRNEIDAAIGEMEAALRLAPLNKPVRVRLANLYMAANPPQWTHFDDILHVAQANEQLKSDPTWWEIQASGLFKRNQVSDALAMMRQAMAMAPDNAAIEHDYINLLLQAKQYSDAVTEIDRVLGSGKQFWWLHDMRGLALVQQGQKAQALQEFQTALAAVDAAGEHDSAANIIMTIGQQIDPDTALTVLQPRLSSNLSWKLLAAQMSIMKKDFPAALKLARDVADDPLSTSGQRLTATQFVAESAQQQRLFDQSKTAYLSWLDQSPGDLVAMNNLACLLNDDLNQPREALQYSSKAFAKASDAGPHINPLIADTQGWVLVRCGGDSAKLGISLLQQLVQNHGDLIDPRYHLAEGYIQSGNNDAAKTQLTAALDLIKTQETKHLAVPDQLKKNIEQAMKQASAKTEATVH